MGMTAAQLEASMPVAELVEHFAEMTLTSQEQERARKAAERKAKAKPNRRGRR